MAAEPFLSLRLVGDRFDEHSIPLSFLRRLSGLEASIAELAKVSFLVDHPGEAVPRGLTRGARLGLTALTEGSAVAEIGVVYSNQASRYSRHYFNDGCNALVGIMAEMETEQDIPIRVINTFKGIGRELDPGDHMEVSTRFSNNIITLTKDSSLLRGETSARSSGSLASPGSTAMAVSGRVSSVDHIDEAFRILLLDGRFATAPLALDRENRGIVFEAFEMYERGVQLHIEGAGMVRRAVPQVVFDTISHIHLVEPRTDTARQITRLRSLEDGWLEGGGKAPSSEGLDWLSQAFDRHYSTDLPTPYIYPTEEGGVQSEWTFGAIDINVRIDLSSRRALYFWLDDHIEEERELNLADSAEWEWLAMNIRKCAEQ